MRRDEFLSSGGFDDDYFAYLEDVDFGWRQWIFGRRIVAEPRAVARHRGGATGEALGVFSRGFLFEKNAFATVYKNLDAEHFRDLMPAVLMTFRDARRRDAARRAIRAPPSSTRDPYASGGRRGRRGLRAQPLACQGLRVAINSVNAPRAEPFCNFNEMAAGSGGGVEIISLGPYRQPLQNFPEHCRRVQHAQN